MRIKLISVVLIWIHISCSPVQSTGEVKSTRASSAGTSGEFLWQSVRDISERSGGDNIVESIKTEEDRDGDVDLAYMTQNFISFIENNDIYCRFKVSDYTLGKLGVDKVEVGSRTKYFIYCKDRKNVVKLLTDGLIDQAQAMNPNEELCVHKSKKLELRSESFGNAVDCGLESSESSEETETLSHKSKKEDYKNEIDDLHKKVENLRECTYPKDKRAFQGECNLSLLDKTVARISMYDVRRSLEAALNHIGDKADEEFCKELKNGLDKYNKEFLDSKYPSVQSAYKEHEKIHNSVCK